MTYMGRVDEQADYNSEKTDILSLHSHEWEQYAPSVAVQLTTARRTKTGHRHSCLRTNSWSFVSFILLCLSFRYIDAHATTSTTTSTTSPTLYGEYSSVSGASSTDVKRKLQEVSTGHITNAPTDPPTKEPTKKPTDSPTKHPTKEPTRLPSSRPTKVPSPFPSETWSTKPTISPTRSPTATPSYSPTDHPSKRPTSLPTSSPTGFPTSNPSSSPSVSVQPSQFPTSTPTNNPTKSPSASPSYSLQELEFFLVFQFDDLNEFSGKATTELEDLTSETVEATLEGSRNDDFDVSAYLSYQQPFDYGSTEGTRRNLVANRRLQSSGWEVGIEVYVETRSGTTYEDDDMKDIIARAFDSEDERKDFFNELQKRDNSFRRINSMEVRINDEDVPVAEPGIESWVYIGAGIGAGALIVSVFLLFMHRRRRREQSAYSRAQFEDPGYNQPGPVASMIEVEPEDQDISTLGDPVYGGPTGMFTAANVFQGDEPTSESHELSAGYDYKMAYGGAGDMPSVSTAGGTRSAAGTRALADDLTTDESRLQIGASYADTSVISNSDPHGVSTFEEDNSFEQMYGEEERIEITAPPGKLGVVIDTPMNGVPMVHAIKETSVLGSRIRIGDKLVSVDGEDTTQMSAIRVSKLISSKAMNPKRHMVFLRSAAPS